MLFLRGGTFNLIFFCNKRLQARIALELAHALYFRTAVSGSIFSDRYYQGAATVITRHTQTKAKLKLLGYTYIQYIHIHIRMSVLPLETSRGWWHPIAEEIVGRSEHAPAPIPFPPTNLEPQAPPTQVGKNIKRKTHGLFFSLREDSSKRASLTLTWPSMVHTLLPDRRSQTRAIPPRSPVATRAPSCPPVERLRVQGDTEFGPRT